MGHKQKIKQARREQAEGKRKAKPAVPHSGRIRWGWILAVALPMLAVVVAGMVLFAQNKDRLIRTAVLAQAYDVEDRLNAQIAHFSTEQSSRMSELLREIHVVGNTPLLDLQAAGQLKFILGAMDEIIRAGNLEAGELEKLQMLLDAVRQHLNRAARREKPARP
jgi:hypothetical protein